MISSEGAAAGGQKALALLRGDDPSAAITHSDTGDYRFVHAGLLAPYTAPARVAAVKCGYGSLCRVDIQPLVPAASASVPLPPPAGAQPRLSAAAPSGAPLLIQCWAGDVSRGVDHMPAAAAGAAGAASSTAGSADGVTAGNAAEVAAAAAAASAAASAMELTGLPATELAIVAAPSLDPEQVELW